MASCILFGEMTVPFTLEKRRLLIVRKKGSVRRLRKALEKELRSHMSILDGRITGDLPKSFPVLYPLKGRYGLSVRFLSLHEIRYLFRTGNAPSSLDMAQSTVKKATTTTS